jgi:tetratricopeptide (TPR) repeat protein
MALEDWATAAEVFDTFRAAYPEHELQRDATRQVAYAYREDGQLFRAADEYDRVAAESEDPALRSEALLVAGDLYEQSDSPDRALDVYSRYVGEFPEPVEMNVETRFKIAEIHRAASDDSAYLAELERIVAIDAEAGPERTPRTRTLAGRSALVLAERIFDEFVRLKLLQPFESSLETKQQRMDETIDVMSELVDYEIADVTAAATYYMAETYFDFSRSLAESERPTDLQPAEREQYEMSLDAAAFPFEERTIDVHEANIELLHAGVFNEWTRKSLDRLSVLMPGRYAKDEASSGFLGVIDSHRYELPLSEAAAPGPAVDDEEREENANPQ